jgi:hypothetical protein
MNHKIVIINWLDSKGITNQWEYIEDIEPLKPCICESIGFLIEETEEYKTIAQSINESQILGRTTIPCCSIKNVEYLTSSLNGERNGQK